MKRPLFSLVYTDENIVAVNKSSGVAVSPDRWEPSLERLDKLVEDSLNAANAGSGQDASQNQKLFTVHRIDRDTSGLVVFAKNSEAHKTLSMAFEHRQVKKRYIAAVSGRPSWNETSCDLPLVPNGNKQHLTIIDKYRGKKSLTTFRLLGSTGNYSIVEAFPETGRTHQIRVHLAALGHSVVQDRLYGNTKPVLLSAIKRGWRGDLFEEQSLISRLGLHAAEIFIPDYKSKEGLRIAAPLYKDMAALVKQMEKAAGREFGV